MHQCLFPLWFEFLNAARCDSCVVSSRSFCARDAHKRFVPLCIEAFRFIIFLHNDRLLIAFLFRLLYQMLLPHYCAIHKTKYFIVGPIYLYINILLYMWYYWWLVMLHIALCMVVKYILPDLVQHLFTFICSPLNNALFPHILIL